MHSIQQEHQPDSWHYTRTIKLEDKRWIKQTAPNLKPKQSLKIFWLVIDKLTDFLREDESVTEDQYKKLNIILSQLTLLYQVEKRKHGD